MSELIPQYNAVSFINTTKRKGEDSVNLVLQLLCTSIADGIAISRDDIKNLYWIFRSKGEQTARVETRAYYFEQLSYDQFMSDWRTERNAMGWFKTNLANAILQGKLLVLPVINI